MTKITLPEPFLSQFIDFCRALDDKLSGIRIGFEQSKILMAQTLDEQAKREQHNGISSTQLPE